MTAMMSLAPNMLPRFSSIVLRSARLLSTSPNMLIKDIKHTEEGNKIVVEGIKVSETSANTALTASGCGSGQANCHPFCNSPIVGQVKHTDVLILDQFVDSKGQMYSQEDLEICPVGDCVIAISIDKSDVAEAVDEVTQAGPDVSKGRADAWQGILC